MEVSRKYPDLLAAANDTGAEFRVVLEETITNLAPDVRDFLKRKGVKIIGVRRLFDIEQGAPPLAHGLYRAADSHVYVAEEIMVKTGNWIRNDSVAFTTRHEIGHALNEHVSSQRISDSRMFVGAYERDIAQCTAEQLRMLGKLAKNDPSAREEVFCEIFALTTGAAPSLAYERLLRQSFPSICKVLDE